MWGDTPWLIDENAHDGLVKKIMKGSKPMPRKADVTFQLQLPNEWDPSLGVYNVGITAGVETDKCNPAWLTDTKSGCSVMNMVIVPSQHVKKTFENTGMLFTPMHVIPEAFSDACLTSEDKLPNPIKFDTSFNFLVFGQLTGNNPENDRKNIFYTIKWLCEAFADDKDVGIVLKTNAGRNTLIDKQNTTAVIKQLVAETRKNNQFPKVHLLHGDMNDDEVVALYRNPSIKALVALTRGEGFGLPILEAAACGLPVIATGWSGHMDFLKHGKFVNVFYQLQQIDKTRADNNIFMPGSRWAQPSEQDFKKRVLKFRNNSTVPREWASDLSQKIKEEYNEKHIYKLYDELLKDIL
jgi:glycosyltransferase involved in cell wall biosynthesis